MFKQSMITVPEWAARAFFYHIYPIGFLDAPLRNEGGEVQPRLANLRRWYDHLASMGVTAIYFGPIFESGSHGYDTYDYFSIDRRLGDIDLFRHIVDELHQRNIRVILDGVFYHTGREFFAFKDVREHKRASRYVDWYLINWGADSHYQDGFAYKSWEDHQSLPRLNHENPEVRKYLFEVARMWLGDVGVDGWRLDVAHQISPEFWWEFRSVCKEVRPDCLLVGEVVTGDYRRWVAPDLLDSGTNYQGYEPLIESLNAGDFSHLSAAAERAFHPEWGVYSDLHLMNFIGNHDVTRIASLLNSPSLIYPALIYLLTTRGIPCLYYGEEMGMLGRKEEGDPALRTAPPAPDANWPDADRAIYRAIASLAMIRQQHPALLYGTLSPIYAKGKLFAYIRQHSSEWALVILNSGEKVARASFDVAAEGIPDGTHFIDMLDEAKPSFEVKNGKLEINKIWSHWGMILASQPK